MHEDEFRVQFVATNGLIRCCVWPRGVDPKKKPEWAMTEYYSTLEWLNGGLDEEGFEAVKTRFGLMVDEALTSPKVVRFRSPEHLLFQRRALEWANPDMPTSMPINDLNGATLREPIRR